jgi:hypothetical protein
MPWVGKHAAAVEKAGAPHGLENYENAHIAKGHEQILLEETSKKSRSVLCRKYQRKI